MLCNTNLGQMHGQDTENVKQERPILVVLHQEQSTPGRVGRKLIERGFTLQVCKPRFGDPLPPDIHAYHAAIVFGGPQSANDPDDYIRKEIDWIANFLEHDHKFLGICLGAQMLVRQMGGRVEKHPHGLVEAGYYTIEPTNIGRQLIQWPEKVYQFHTEGMSLPQGCTQLARNDTFENQAFKVSDEIFGIQFHPEVTTRMAQIWRTRGAYRLTSPNARPGITHVSERALFDPAIEVWLEDFLDLWLALPHVPV